MWPLACDKKRTQTSVCMYIRVLVVKTCIKNHYEVEKKSNSYNIIKTKSYNPRIFRTYVYMCVSVAARGFV